MKHIQFTEKFISELSLENNKRFVGEVAISDTALSLEIVGLFESFKKTGIQGHENIAVRRNATGYYVVEGNTRIALIKYCIHKKNGTKASDLEKFDISDTKLTSEITKEVAARLVREFIENIYYYELKTEEEERNLLTTLVSNKKLPFSKISDALILAPELGEGIRLQDKRYLALYGLLVEKISNDPKKYKKFSNSPRVLVDFVTSKHFNKELKNNLYNLFGLKIKYKEEEKYFFVFEGENKELYKDVVEKALDYYVTIGFNEIKNGTLETLLNILGIDITKYNSRVKKTTKSDNNSPNCDEDEESKVENEVVTKISKYIKDKTFTIDRNVNDLDILYGTYLHKHRNDINLSCKEHPAIITSRKNISCQAPVGTYKICVNYKDSKFMCIVDIVVKSTKLSLNTVTKDSQLNELIEKYIKIGGGDKLISYILVSKQISETVAIPLLIQSFIELNCRLYVQELEGVKFIDLNPAYKGDSSTVIIVEKNNKKVNIGNYVGILNASNIKTSPKFQDLYKKLNDYKHYLDVPIPEEIINQYFMYVHQIIDEMLDKIISYKNK